MECKHGVNMFGVAACYNCVIEENQRLEAILGAADRLTARVTETLLENPKFYDTPLHRDFLAYCEARGEEAHENNG